MKLVFKLTWVALTWAALLVLAASGFGQTPAPKSTVPRGADGKPDLSGVWQGGSTVAGSWEEANSGTGVGGTGTNPNAPVAPASTDRLTREGAPYQPWAAKKVLESFNKRAIDDPTSLCLPPGVPRTVTLGLFPQQMIQTPTQLVVLYEYMNVFRVIPLNVKHHEDAAPAYMGDSVAHWEGDTLVVETTNFNDQTHYRGSSMNLKVTERFKRVSDKTIEYRATIEDPSTWSKPWSIELPFDSVPGPLFEYACHEGNYAIVSILGAK